MFPHNRAWYTCPNFSHHPNIGDMISKYLQQLLESDSNVMFKMPKVGHLPKPASFPPPWPALRAARSVATTTGASSRGRHAPVLERQLGEEKWWTTSRAEGLFIPIKNRGYIYGYMIYDDIWVLILILFYHVTWYMFSENDLIMFWSWLTHHGSRYHKRAKEVW